MNAWWKNTGRSANDASRSSSVISRKRKQDASNKNSGDSSTSVQLCLDVGLKGFTRVACPQCGCVYLPGDQADEAVHAQHHNAATTCLRFPGWSNERCILRDPCGSRMLLVLHGDPASHFNKVASLCAFMEQSLGLDQGWVMRTQQQHHYTHFKKQQAAAAPVTALARQAHAQTPACGRLSSNTGDKPHSTQGQPSGLVAQGSAVMPVPQSQCYLLYVNSNRQVGAIMVVERLMPSTQGEAGGASTNWVDLGRTGRTSHEATNTNRDVHQVPRSNGVSLHSHDDSSSAAPGPPACLGHHSPETFVRGEQIDAVGVSLQPLDTSNHSDGGGGSERHARCGDAGPAATAAVALGVRQPEVAGLRTGPSSPAVVPASSSARLGVRAVWVLPALRRARVATRMLNVGRCHLITGYVVVPKQVAWALETVMDMAGLSFAAAWTQTHTCTTQGLQSVPSVEVESGQVAVSVPVPTYHS